MRNSYGGWRPYVPVARRRAQAARKVAAMVKAGHEISPVTIAGRKIAQTFWGQAWCKNLESYSDYSNRLPRGRTYVRNGSVIDLGIESGGVQALVSGTDIYKVEVGIKPLAKGRWNEVKGLCAGQIGSLIELLRGSISERVMEIVTRKGEGLFPEPREISLSCSCPDWAGMCKHVAATLYAVGARLDQEPELLFRLRGVDPAEMVETALDQSAPGGQSGRRRGLKPEQLSSVFGIELDLGGEGAGKKAGKRSTAAAKSAKKRKGKSTRKAATKHSSANSGTRKAGIRKTRKAAPKKKP